MNNQIKILTIFGTRPEVIKLAPFIKAVENDSSCLSVTCATTQHRELQNSVLNLFNIKPHYNLDIMRENQTLSYLLGAVVNDVTKILMQERPDFVVMQGDTTTALGAALASFYQKIPIIHIEAGLRTGNLYSPFPEESNRALISRIATLHMAPTLRAKENLHKEGIHQNVFMVGNTIVDSVHWGINNFKSDDQVIKQFLMDSKRKVLITVHRRENFGYALDEICSAIHDLCISNPTHCFIWPVHPNPNVNTIVYSRLQGVPNLKLVAPLAYNELIILIDSCDFIISDSGGIQEEAAILGKKIIVLREETERMEIIDAGVGVLVGSNKNKILDACQTLLKCKNTIPDDLIKNTYGTLGVSIKILEKIKEYK